MSQGADDLLVLLAAAETEAAPARVRFGFFRVVGGTTIQIDDIELATSVADLPFTKLVDVADQVRGSVESAEVL